MYYSVVKKNGVYRERFWKMHPQTIHAESYSKNYIEIDFGSVLIDLLNFDFTSCNSCKNMECIYYRNKSKNISVNCNSFNTLSNASKLLFPLFYKPSYKIDNEVKIKINDTLDTIELVKASIAKYGNCSNDYFSYLFNMINSGDTNNNINLVNYYKAYDMIDYILAIAYFHINHFISDSTIKKEKIEELKKIYLNFAKAYNKNDKLETIAINNIINFLPEKSICLEVCQQIFSVDHPMIFARKYLNVNEIIKLFSNTNQKIIFIKAIYEYDKFYYNHLYEINTVIDYIKIAILKCYDQNYSIKQCPQCKKYFIKKENARIFCCNNCFIDYCERLKQSRYGEINGDKILGSIRKSLFYKSGTCPEIDEKETTIVEIYDKITRNSKISQTIYDITELIYDFLIEYNLFSKKVIRAISTNDKHSLYIKCYQYWLKKVDETYKRKNIKKILKNCISSTAEYFCLDIYFIDYSKIEMNNNLNFDLKDNILINKSINFPIHYNDIKNELYIDDDLIHSLRDEIYTLMFNQIESTIYIISKNNIIDVSLFDLNKKFNRCVNFKYIK